MAKLFEPLKLRSLELKNRIGVSPMCQYSSEDGFANDWHLVHLGARAVGGAALVITEATAVSPEGRITPHDLGIWKEEHLEKLHQITSFIKNHGAIAGIQLAHAGRKASHHRPWDGGAALTAAEGAWPTLAPAALPFKDAEPAPLALDKQGIIDLTMDFKQAAARALKAGYQLLEIHAAHGYLLHEFLSPLSNNRTDEYGGSFENRIRILLEVTDGIRSVWPDELPLFVRLSASDWKEGGWTVEDSVALSRKLTEHGVDLVDCSSGGNVPGVRFPVGALYQTPFAEKIRREAGIKTAAVGLITTPRECEHIVASGKADLVLLARQSLRDPHFPLHAARELGVDLPWPVQYDRAKL